MSHGNEIGEYKDAATDIHLFRSANCVSFGVLIFLGYNTNV